MPGIGPYTAAAIAAIAFDEPEIVVDGNVERVMARVFAVETPLPAAKPDLTAVAASLTPTDRPGDYAQAVMDLGATICTPRNPACGLCPWSVACQARAAGIAGRPAAQAPSPQADAGRHRLARPPRRGAVLLERRPDRGPSGRHAGLSRRRLGRRDRRPAAGRRLAGRGEVRHTFTHFHLILPSWWPMSRDTCTPCAANSLVPT